jgi:hypothetical protein
MSGPLPPNNSALAAERPITTASTDTAVALDMAATEPIQDDSRRSSVATANNGEGGVNVEQAEKEFGELRRQLSKVSSLHRIKTGEKDAEKEGEDEEDFDLLAYLVRRLLFCFSERVFPPVEILFLLTWKS